MSLRDEAIAALREEWKRQTFINHAALLDALLDYLEVRLPITEDESADGLLAELREDYDADT